MKFPHGCCPKNKNQSRNLRLKNIFVKMDWLNLNELPTDLVDDTNDAVGEGCATTTLPSYCTQPALRGEVSQAICIEGNVVAPHNGSMQFASYEGQVGQIESTNFNQDTTSMPDNDNDDVEIPEDEVLSQPSEPYLGMRFDTLLCAKDHYNAYALRLGFSTRSSTSKRSVYTNEVEKQLFVCNKFRKPKVDGEKTQKTKVAPDVSSESEVDSEDENDQEDALHVGKKPRKKRRRETMKGTNCKARLIVKLMDNIWQVVYFIAEHNHPLINKPSLTKYLRSHQGIPKEEENFLRILHDSNLETGHMMQLMSSFYGSGLLVPYTTKAISNYRSRMRAQTRGGDMTETISYFTQKRLDDPDFYFKVLLDDEQRVQNLFWVDGAARTAYEDAYSDCISFDTTYLTNQYNMPFAPFIGINRHGQSFMLGCGFLRDEKATSFDWLFETYLDAMNDKAPKNIITDQDWAMHASIAKVLPNTVHRSYRWHIMKKAQEKLGSFLGRRPEFVAQFNEVVDYSLTPEEFEQSWAQMMEVHQDVAGNKHIAWLYNIRATWIPCYFRNCFFPILQSTNAVKALMLC